MVENIQRLILCILTACVLFALFSVQYDSYSDRLLAAPQRSPYAYDPLTDNEMQERVQILSNFFLDKLKKKKIEGYRSINEDSILDLTREFINHTWEQELANRFPVVSEHNRVNVFFLMAAGEYTVPQGEEQMRRFEGIHGSQVFSHPLQYVILDRQLLERWFPHDFQLFRYTWCDWRHYKSEKVLPKSIFHDEVSARDHSKGHFYVDAPRGLPEVHSQYSENGRTILEREFIHDPDVKQNPYNQDTHPREYFEHDRYRKFHEFFRDNIPTDVAGSSISYPIGYWELWSDVRAHIFLNQETADDDKYGMRIKGGKYRIVFDYANGIFYLSHHYERWKIVYHENTLRLVSIGQNIKDDFVLNPFFRLELQLTGQDCSEVWYEE